MWPAHRFYSGMSLLLAVGISCGCQKAESTEAPQTTTPQTRTSKPAGVFPNEELLVQDQKRTYRLIVPKSINRNQPAPLMVAFHGMLIDNKDVMPIYTKLPQLAAKEKFLLAFPQALKGSWGIDPKKVSADLAFFDALIAEIAKTYRVDQNRIYVLGMSNGGYFAHLVGKERSETVAAVCSHSGPLGLQTLLGIGAKRKFPVMIIHGEKDNLFPVAFAQENQAKYKRERHPVTYVEVPNSNTNGPRA